MKDLNTWIKSRGDLGLDDIKKSIEDFSSLNLKYINYIYSFILKHSLIDLHYKLLEPGCGFGAGTNFLSKRLSTFDFTLLDYDQKVIEDIQIIYSNQNKKFSCLTQDMFNMSFQDGIFDFIYNNGVLEHFTLEERINILKEYSRVLKKGGYMFIVIPNHYNLIYKLFYIIANLLKRWRVAKEFSIYDFKKECKKIGLEFIERKTFVENSLYGILTLLIIKKN